MKCWITMPVLRISLIYNIPDRLLEDTISDISINMTFTLFNDVIVGVVSCLIVSYIHGQ